MPLKLKYYIKIGLLLLIVFTNVTCKKKCRKSNYQTFNSPLLEMIDIPDVKQGSTFGTVNIKLYVDSTAFYSDWDLKSKFNFNNYSLIYISLKGKKETPNCYIENTTYSLTDEGSNYALNVTYCTSKFCKFKRSYLIDGLIKTNKLQNKPINTNIRYEN